MLEGPATLLLTDLRKIQARFSIASAAPSVEMRDVEDPLDTVHRVVEKLDSPVTSLWEAAARGDLEKVRKFLSEGTRTDTLGEDGTTPLWVAAAKGHADVVECLLSHDAHINWQNSQEITPLWIAAHHGHLSVVRVLLAHRASLELSDNEIGATPFIAAISAGHRAIAEVLLRSGANPNDTCKDGTTALHICTMSRDLKLIELILKQPNVDTQKVADEHRAFSIAQELGDHVIADLIDCYIPRAEEPCIESQQSHMAMQV